MKKSVNKLLQSTIKSDTASLLYDLAPSGYFTIDKEGMISELNLYGAKMLGDEKSMLVNQNFRLFVSTDSISRFDQFISDTLETKIKQSCEISLTIPGQSSIFIRLEGIASPYEEKCLMIAVDLTQRKQEEEALRESEYFFRESQRAAFIGSYKTNFITGFWESSEVLDQIFGIDKAYIRSVQGWLDLVHRDDKAMMEYHLNVDVIAKQKPFKKEYRIIRRSDGETRWVQGLGEAKFDSDQKILFLFGTIQDITDHKHSEESLKMSENQFRDLFENAHIGIFHSLPKGKFLNVNQTITKILGYSSTEELINNITDISSQIYVDPAERAFFIDELSNNNEWIHQHDVVWHKKDGSLITVDMTGRRVLDSDGTIAYFESFIVDITDKQAAERLLAQTRQNYETFFNTIDEFLFVLDENGNIQHTNTTVTDRLGYTMEELTGQSVLMVHPMERRSEAGRIVGEMLSGKSEFCPVPLITKKGKLIPVETRVKSGIWDGRPAIFGVTKDISQIMLSEEKFSKVFYINPSACGLSDLDTGKYIEVNQAFYTLFGFNKDEVIGKTALELGIMTNEKMKFLKHKTDINGITLDLEAELYTKSGEAKHVLLSTENIYVQDKKMRYTVVHDITLRKQSEIALRESEIQLRELNATKDKFFSIIGHDLKNPFQAIIGFSNILADHVKELDHQDIEEYANTIQSSAMRAMSLLNDLLDWARLQNGKMTFAPRNLDLVELIHEVKDLINDFSQQKNVTIVTNLPEFAFVNCDKSMIKSVLRNLFSNAIKFSNTFGKVTVQIDQNPSELIVSIKDNGVGIRKETMNKLFRMEETYSTPGTNNETGTGLGLLLCKEFIIKHNGRIWAESESGEGSKFYFTIPL